MQCGDVARAVFALSRANARMLGALAWRGTEVERVTARWRPDQYVEIAPREIARANPWAGIPGCIYVGHASNDAASYFVGCIRGLDDRLCNRPEMRGIDANAIVAAARRIGGEPTPDMAADDERWRIPPSLSMILQPLEALHRPGGALYRTYTDAAGTDAHAAPFRYGPNRIDIGGASVDVGFSVDTTIDPTLQALAQKTAACYTGRDDVCRSLGITRKEDAAQPIGHRMLEHAMVRMAAIAIVDVTS